MNNATGYRCADARAAIPRWLCEELSLEQVRELQCHLRECSDCHASFIAASASKFFGQQDARRQAANSAAGVSVDDVGLVDAATSRQGQQPVDYKPADNVLLLTDSGGPVRSPGSHLPPTSRNDLPFAFAKCESVHEVLRQLLPIARELGVKNLRYHYFSDRDARLASVDGVGHRPEIDSHLRREAFVRFPTAPLFAESDPYQCFASGRPVIFRAVPEAAGLVRRGDIEGLRVYEVQIERSERTQISPSDCWWSDVPLVTMRRFSGKLSCDLAAKTLADVCARSIYEFWRVAQVAAPLLEAAYAQSVQKALDAVRDEINAIEDCAEFHDFVTTDLPHRVFNCDHASLFTTLEDSEARDLLILRKSSSPGLRRREHRAAYDLSGSRFFLPCVHQSGTSVKLSRLASQQHWQEQMLAYGMEVTWKDPIVDWEAMHSTLATAIRYPKGYPLGVLQLLNKRSKHGRSCAFTDHDVRLAERIVLEVIGPKLHLLTIPKM